ncbi:hypothetical protein GCM10027052_22710 [Parafrigoribacterium mesophilum]|uniref:hypothetical protein n=1 Tax=Parafrigoribacterium mesophilum TaxID=433646 RepID=UPI0031FD8677
MTQTAGEDTNRSRRRLTVTFILLVGLTIAAFAGTVAVLNSTLYSASGFVGSYLNALARHDVSAAMATPGVTRPASGSDDLLVPAALGSLKGISLESDTVSGDGAHRLVYSYSFTGKRERSRFVVERAGVHLGFFSSWRFRVSPMGLLTVTPQHAASFTANGIPLSSPKPAEPTQLRVLTPASVVLGHSSTYFTAKPTAVAVTQPDNVAAEVNIQAGAAFVKELQKQLDAQLKQCTTQKVLLPTGCPFGQHMDNRIEGEPVWSMTSYPKLAIVPGPAIGQWQVPQTPGAAHLKVKVRSLFDGTLSTFDQDVPFTISYSITFSDSGVPTITAR